MAIKLKNNKNYKFINTMVIITLIVLLPIYSIKTYKAKATITNINMYENEKVINYIKEVDNALNQYMMIYKNENGDVEEIHYNGEITSRKESQEIQLAEELKNIEKIGSENNLDNKEINERKEVAKEKIILTDEEIKKTVDEYFEENYNGIMKVLSSHPNLQYIIEDKENNKKLTNIENMDKVDLWEEKGPDTVTLWDKQNYDYIFIPSDKNSKSKDSSENMKNIYSVFDGQVNLFDRYYRIPKELNAGDIIYNLKSDIVFYNKLSTKYLIITMILAFLLIVSVLVNKKIGKVNEKSFLEKLYNKSPLELKIITPAIFIYSLIVVDQNGILYPGAIINLRIIRIISIAVISTLLMYYFLKYVYGVVNKEEIISESLLKKYILKIIKYMNGCYLIQSTGVKITIFIILSCINIVALLYGFLIGTNTPDIQMCRAYNVVYSLILVVYIITTTRGLNILKVSTDNIVKGEYNNNLSVKFPTIIKEISTNIINIESGLDVALEKAIKSEKMKGELITNVSHDLKTPLTSIISYIDLLKKDNLTEEEKSKYINVLDGKSQRLKVLIEDLFEASKAASGNLEIERENLDIISLLRQILGEAEEKITKSELNIVTKWPEEKPILYLDGRKTFRVFENLLSNIIKYSMKASRVYIEVINEEKEVSIIMKNISAYQLDFTAEEAVERFKRGDKSRNTEGSGLGLAIAKSLVELQGGSLYIEIDGDLFKVIVKFQK